jgi:hypothetical protein
LELDKDKLNSQVCRSLHIEKVCHANVFPRHPRDTLYIGPDLGDQPATLEGVPLTKVNKTIRLKRLADLGDVFIIGWFCERCIPCSKTFDIREFIELESVFRIECMVVHDRYSYIGVLSIAKFNKDIPENWLDLVDETKQIRQTPCFFPWRRPKAYRYPQA